MKMPAIKDGGLYFAFKCARCGNTEIREATRICLT